MVQNKGTYYPDLIKIDLSEEKSYTAQSIPLCYIIFKEKKKEINCQQKHVKPRRKTNEKKIDNQGY